MYVQGVDNVYDLNFNGRDGERKVTYGDVFLQAEQEYSRHNFEHADTGDAVRAVRDGGSAPAGNIWMPAGKGRQRRRQRPPPDGAAGLRPVHQGEPRLQPARRPRRHLGHRAPELHPARARTRQGLRRGLARRPRAAARSILPGCTRRQSQSDRADHEMPELLLELSPKKSPRACSARPPRT